MTKREFIEHYEIADARPLDPSRKALPAEGFAAAIVEFLEVRFPGAVQIEMSEVAAHAIHVCAEYVADFFKSLLTDVYGRVMLCIQIKSEDDHIAIYITSDQTIPLTVGEERQLMRAARNGGFGILLTDEYIKLTAKYTPYIRRRVYAMSVMDSHRIMLGKMVEIFCHGELLSADPPPPIKLREPMKKRPPRKKKKE